MTTEQTKAISSTFDSVNLINTLNAKESRTTEETACIVRNIAHLRIMMAKTAFVATLSSGQVTTINALLV